MSQLVLDKVFLGVDGIDAQRGLTTFYIEEAALNAVMIRQAKKKIVVADHSKFGIVGHHVFGTVQDIDLIITDVKTPEAIVEAYRAKGVEIKCV